MPILINNETGLAEDVAHPDLALKQGSHEIPLVDAEGNHFTATYQDASALMQQGYRQPLPEELSHLLRYAKHSSTSEQLKTFGEGAAEAATFGASTAVEKFAGTKDEDILGRREINPGVHGLGQVAGLTGSMFLPGEGVIGALGAAGKVATRLGPVGVSLASQAARAALKQATEAALFQVGNEVSKAIVNDPKQSAESFVSDVGLVGLLGGALGGAGPLVVKPLWQATKGVKLGNMLSAIREKAENAAESQVAREAMEAAGVELSPAVRGAMSPKGERAAQVLEQADSRAGKAFREARKADEIQLDEAILQGLGKEGKGPAVSQAEAGQVVKDAFEADLDNGAGPVLDEYKAVTKDLDGAPLPRDIVHERIPTDAPLAPGFMANAAGVEDTALGMEAKVTSPIHSEIAEGVNKIGIEDGHFKSPSSQEAGQIRRIMKELPLQETIGDLRNFKSKVVNDLRSSNAFHFAGRVGHVFDDAIENATEKALGEKAPELLGRYASVKRDYRMVKEMLEYLNDHLHVGKSGGVESFLENFRSMEPEKILSRLKATKDAGLQQFLQERMPEVANAIKSHQLDAILEKANSYKSLSLAQGFFKELDKLTPEAKAFILPTGAEERLTAVRTLVDRLPKSGNPSKTSGMMDSLNKHMAGGLGSVIAVATGHNPVVGAITGEAGRFIAREIPDHARLSMLKFLGSDAPVNSSAFKAMSEAAEVMHKADSALTKASRAVFEAGSDVIENQTAHSDDIQKLDSHLRAAQQQPERLSNVAGDLGHYMPEHAAALGATTARAVGYLNSLRPNTSPPGPLDPMRKVSDVEKAAYERQLGLANKPLLILQRIKQGTILPQDVTTLKTLYPSLYNHMSQKLLESAIDHKSKGGNIPYKARLGLSAFSGQPLDSSITPLNILSNQPPPPMPPAQPNSKAGALNKLPGLSMSGPQAREAHKQGKA